MKSTLTVVLSFFFLMEVFAQERCLSEVLMNQLFQKSPESADHLMTIKSKALDWAKKNQHNRYKTTLKVPVVVHIVYNTPDQNISDAQVYSQIKVLNEDYLRLNSDTVNTPPYFATVAGNSNIEFVLAKQDPFGEPTTGITRTKTLQTGFDLKKNTFIAASVTGGKNAWPTQEFLNIWVCNLTGTGLGVASFPEMGDPRADGFVVDYEAFGTIGTAKAPFNLGRTATHEIGHWLGGLNHTFSTNGCSDADGIADTPIQNGPTSGCPSGIVNTCGTANGNMYQNYMDYTNDACMNLFTKMQVDQIQGTLNTTRSKLLTSKGLQEPAPCMASVSQLPFEEGFEGNFPPVNWKLYNEDKDNGALRDVTWAKTTKAARSGMGSVFMHNYEYEISNQIDEMVLPVFDFTNYTNIRLEFDLAYANYTPPDSGYSEELEVKLSIDCGRIESTEFFKGQGQLSTASYTQNEFIPNSSQWRHEQVNLNKYSGKKNVLIKFRHKSDYENNLYIDNIRITGDPVSTHVGELGQDELTVSPNPATNWISIRGIDITSYSIYNISGQKLVNAVVPDKNQSLNIENLKPGCYLLSVTSTQQHTYVKRIIIN